MSSLPPPPSGTSSAVAASPITATDPYSKFISDPATSIDVVDHVAYSLYKRDKLAFIVAHKQFGGVLPTDTEMGVFVCASTLDSRISSYKSEASQILQGFCEAVLTNASDEERVKQKKHFYNELKRARPFWRNMLENMFANMAALALTALVVIAIYGTRISAVSLMGDIFGYDIKERPPTVLTVQPTAKSGNGAAASAPP